MRNNIQHIGSLFITTLLFFMMASSVPAIATSEAQNHDVFEKFTDDYASGVDKECTACTVSKTCQIYNGSTIPLWLKSLVIFLLMTGGFIYISKKFNWKIAAVLLALIAMGFVPKKTICTTEESLISINSEKEYNDLEESKGTVLEDEFEEFNESAEFEAIGEKENFEAITSKDEFNSFSEEKVTNSEVESNSLWSDSHFKISVIVLLLTIVAGILVRFKTTRKLKIFMLLGSIIYLGFIRGACPCMISSFQNTILYLNDVSVKPITMLWFLGLLPLTYLLGKVWCGWVCHLGALQEFLFRPGTIKILQNQKSQLILKWVRIITLFVLIIQLIVTQTNIFIHYDPFKVAFNLFSANTLGYILLVILLISSVLIYRPFCRTLCPVGLILGWISYIPGAVKLNKNNTCIDCKSCGNACRQNAMIYENKKSVLNNEDCILCGDCMDSCNFNSLKITTGITKK